MNESVNEAMNETVNDTLDETPAHTVTSDMTLLHDVEMPLSVSFGSTFMPLRDVLKLTTGSIVEMDRMISEPVDIIVNNCVIARGEVVVIEGNYGVRILDVVSRSDRMAVRNTGRPLPEYDEFPMKSGA
jgi:flagellar motor switch protein FliN/FliY